MNASIHQNDPTTSANNVASKEAIATERTAVEPPPELLTKEEVAELIRLTPRTVEKWMALGRLPHIKIGKTVRFSRASVLRHLHSREVFRSARSE